MREMRNAYKILAGKPEVKQSLARPSRKWESDIKMNLEEVDFRDVGKTFLAKGSFQ
jgi:hypothetical protein